MLFIIVSSVIFSLFVIFGLLEVFYVNKVVFKVKTNNFYIRRIAMLGVMIALAWALSLLQIRIIPAVISITLNFLPLIIIGVMYGPFYGFLAGVFSNLLFALVGLSTTFNLGYTLSSGLDGAVPGLFVLAGWNFINFHIKKIYSKQTLFCISLAIFFLIEIIMLLVILTNIETLKIMINDISNKIGDPTLMCYLLFICGTILNILFFIVCYFFMKKKFSYFSILIILSFQIARVFIIALALNPIWAKHIYGIDTILWKIIELPLSLFINILVVVPACYIVYTIDKKNLFSMLETSYRNLTSSENTIISPANTIKKNHLKQLNKR